MGTIKRRQRVSQRELGPYKRYELLTGRINYVYVGYTGYGNATGKSPANSFPTKCERIGRPTARSF
jgi:hypothetical protein